MDQLQELIKMSDALKDMKDFLKEANDIHTKSRDSLVRAGEFIATADLHQCKWLLNELSDRVATLTGCCDHIEDAISDINLCLEDE